MNTYNQQLNTLHNITICHTTQWNRQDVQHRINDTETCTDVLVCFCAGFHLQKSPIFILLHRFKQSVDSIKKERQLTVEPPVKDCTDFNTKDIVNVLLCKLSISFANYWEYITNLYCTKQRLYTIEKYLSWDLVRKTSFRWSPVFM